MYQRFAYLLTQKNLKAADVAKATGISKTVFSGWKNGQYTPKLDKLEKIAAFLEVPVTYFFDSPSITNSSNSSLSTHTLDVAKKYEQLNGEQQAAVETIIDCFLKDYHADVDKK